MRKITCFIWQSSLIESQIDKTNAFSFLISGYNIQHFIQYKSITYIMESIITLLNTILKCQDNNTFLYDIFKNISIIMFQWYLVVYSLAINVYLRTSKNTIFWHHGPFIYIIINNHNIHNINVTSFISNMAWPAFKFMFNCNQGHSSPIGAISNSKSGNQSYW